tara:strand:+ start:398 stop:646 length:249 start_codon:yes stop_codon:yes gene_type:complete
MGGKLFKTLLEEYIHYFGDQPPFPPKHIMKSLVQMKKDGTFEERVKNAPEILKKSEDILGEKIDLNHDILNVDFSDDENGNE